MYVKKPYTGSMVIVLCTWPILLCQDDANSDSYIFGCGLGTAGQGRVEGPGILRLTGAHLPGGPQASMSRRVLTIPLQRPGNKTEVAHGVLYLASPLASYVTGAVLVVDGGAWLTYPNDIELDFSSSAKL